MAAYLSLALLGISWGYAVGAYGGVEAPSWRWCILGFAAAGLLLWLFPNGRKPAPPRGPGLLLLLFIVAIAALQIVPLPLEAIHWISPHRFAQLTGAAREAGKLRTATLSSVPEASRDEALQLCSYVLVFLIVCDLRRRFQDRYWILIAPLVLIATLEAALGILQYYNGMDYAVGTYVNRNHFAGLLEMTLPLAVMFGFFVIHGNRDRFRTPARPTIVACLFFGMAAVMLIGVIDSQSRMGFIAVLVSLLITGIVGIGSRYSSAVPVWRRWLPAMALTAAAALAFVFLPTDQLVARFASMAAAQEPSEDMRRQFWKETEPLIADYPLAGCGLGAYSSCFLPYKKTAPDYSVDFAHNDYLQLMAEFGLPGFGFLLCLAALAYGHALRGAVRENRGRYLAIACVGSLSAILLHSFADFNLYVPANGMLAVWVGGLARES